MIETFTITSERVDDIPLLLATLERMGMPPLLDQHFLTHGNFGWASAWAGSACSSCRLFCRRPIIG